MDDLTDLDRQVLAFEARRWRHQGAKDEAVLRELGLSPWRYTQLVLAVAQKPAALAEAPVLVNRLNRLRNRTRRA